MCVSTIGSYSTFGKIVKKHGKTQVESWVFGFSLIFDFSVYLKNSSRITFPPSGGGPCSRSLRCSKESEPNVLAASGICTYQFGGWRQLRHANLNVIIAANPLVSRYVGLYDVFAALFRHSI